MELLPIIYVSLAIFAVVAIATIITSFISYKIRERNEGYKKPYEKEEDASNKNYMKKKIMDSDGKFHTVISDGDKLKDKKSQKHHHKRSSEKRKETDSRKSRPGNSGSRIKIINKPSKPQLPHLPVKTEDKKPEKDLKNINENILNKYTDDENEEFFSLKTSTKKKEDTN